MEYEDNPASIKYYVKRFLLNNRERFAGKKIVDLPAGNGITSRIIQEIGGHPIPLDLFPEYFKVEGLHCQRANIADSLPMENGKADALICQEGIEHFADQMKAFKEFNRILKPGGVLLITTPNYSNLRAKLSYLLSESERFGSIMPPNELDSIWLAKEDITDEIYYGHIFLVGIQKLRVFGKLSGFRIRKVHFTRYKTTSILLFPFLYPFIYLSNWLTYRKNLRRNKNFPSEMVRSTYREIFNLGVDPKILLDGHLMVEYEKESDLKDIAGRLKSKYTGFGTT
jgi:SAM-dependent methyltransferase